MEIISIVSFLGKESFAQPSNSPSKSLTYIDTRPFASSSATSLRAFFSVTCPSLNDPSSPGEGVGLGVIGRRPEEFSGGKVKDGGGGEEFMAIEVKMF